MRTAISCYSRTERETHNADSTLKVLQDLKDYDAFWFEFQLAVLGTWQARMVFGGFKYQCYYNLASWSILLSVVTDQTFTTQTAPLEALWVNALTISASTAQWLSCGNGAKQKPIVSGVLPAGNSMSGILMSDKCTVAALVYFTFATTYYQELEPYEQVH